MSKRYVRFNILCETKLGNGKYYVVVKNCCNEILFAITTNGEKICCCCPYCSHYKIVCTALNNIIPKQLTNYIDMPNDLYCVNIKFIFSKAQQKFYLLDHNYFSPVKYAVLTFRN